ncbi:MAG: hypothetical protein COY58_03090 [Gammaproteobacteria bacterium CG_4_10_14_0_8_um_filter_38_16]|nr:MAG: hypothetical protein COY58_03090 [Gammaproteobacteria bacterium CG_4_10_14_0_8_um_filter_38_16]PJA03913.1 MAG: hypothetical protein COX72_03250 [Gammaproteobacteria bacterium CG_4_10_14_0_2_um_filter_38_22]PJB09582.1 MAG: hypothetical protein CO120_09410 [Gammaproteobacteria bacterium CG_4_9_14_3_um_filter_38_9]
MGKHIREKAKAMPLSLFQAQQTPIALKRHMDPNDADRSANDLTTTPKAPSADTDTVARQFVESVLKGILPNAAQQTVSKKPTIQQETAQRVARFNSIWKKHNNEDRSNAEKRPSITLRNS